MKLLYIFLLVPYISFSQVLTFTSNNQDLKIESKYLANWYYEGSKIAENVSIVNLEDAKGGIYTVEIGCSKSQCLWIKEFEVHQKIIHYTHPCSDGTYLIDKSNSCVVVEEPDIIIPTFIEILGLIHKSLPRA